MHIHAYTSIILVLDCDGLNAYGAYAMACRTTQEHTEQTYYWPILQGVTTKVL